MERFHIHEYSHLKMFGFWCQDTMLNEWVLDLVENNILFYDQMELIMSFIGDIILSVYLLFSQLYIFLGLGKYNISASHRDLNIEVKGSAEVTTWTPSCYYAYLFTWSHNPISFCHILLLFERLFVIT